MTLDEIAKQVESLRAAIEAVRREVERLRAEKPDPAPPNPKCPACGGEMMIVCGKQWRCSDRACWIDGPINDPDGSKVRKLVNIDKLPKVTWEQFNDKWIALADLMANRDTTTESDVRDAFNYFAGCLIVADTKETP